MNSCKFRVDHDPHHNGRMADDKKMATRIEAPGIVVDCIAVG